MGNAKKIPLYKQVADDLLEKIRSGVYPVGSLLPGELELIDLYDSSRHTVREALRVLEDMGIVSRQRGRGTLILSPEAAPAFVQMVNTPAELLSYPPESTFRVTTIETIQADAALAARLGCKRNTTWSRVSGPRTFASGAPLCWTDIYLIPEYASIAEQLSAARRPVYELIADAHGEEVQKISVEVYASVMGERTAAALGLEPGTASLSLCRRYVGNNGRVFEVSVSEHAADNFSYSFEFNRGWQSGDHWSWSK